MAETRVKNRFCRDCGVDVRPHALFCYNCGSSVAPKATPPKNKNKEISGDNLFDADIDSDKASASLKTEILETAEKNGNEENNREKPRLESAASLRRKPKTIQKKRIEIVWEEPDHAPNLWFILVALLLTLFAIGIWLLASSLG